MMKHVLSIAGTDPSGGAGAAADCKTFCAHGCFALNVITLSYPRIPRACAGIWTSRRNSSLRRSMRSLKISTSMPSNRYGQLPETIRVIADKLKQYQPPYVVIDPVMVATSGHRLLVPEAEQTLKEVLLPLADVLTPNLPEAEVLTGKSIEVCMIWKRQPKPLLPWARKASWSRAAIRIADANGHPLRRHDFHYYKGQRLESTSTHGTGCSLSSAIASNLANG